MLTNSRYAISSLPARPRWAFAAAGVAVLFGILTVLSGGRALLVVRPRGQPSAMQWHLYSGLISLLASSTCLAEWACSYGAGGRHNFLPSLLFRLLSFLLPLAGMWRLGALRTVGAMTLRSGFWVGIAVSACQALGCMTHKNVHDHKNAQH